MSGPDLNLDAPWSQQAFGELVGVSQPVVSGFVRAGVLSEGGTARQWLTAYCHRLREQAAGRMGEAGGLDLVQERAALAREQRIGQAMKNAQARGEWAPVGLLADVLSVASSAVVDRFEQLEGALKKTCPDLPEAARTVVLQVIASARNEWVRATATLVAEHLEAITTDDDDGGLAIEDEVAG